MRKTQGNARAVINGLDFTMKRIHGKTEKRILITVSYLYLYTFPLPFQLVAD
jgi:hypothetical protein